MTHTVDCKSLFNSCMIMAKYILDSFDKKPIIHIIKTGYDEPSERYVRNKIKDMEYVGIVPNVFTFSKPNELEDYLETINDTQSFYYNNNCNGIIIQRPILFDGVNYSPEKFNAQIPYSLDIDGARVYSPYPTACVKALDMVLSYIEKTYKLKLNDKITNVTIIGQGSVGKPVYNHLKKIFSDKVEFTINNSKTSTKELYDNITKADLIISAVGFKNPIDIVANKDKIIIDFGIIKDEVTGKLHGDIGNINNPSDFNIIKTSVPNGMGLLVRAALICNIIISVLKYYKE